LEVCLDYIEREAISSACKFVAALTPLKIKSVLDVGCGRGTWLAEWISRGAREQMALISIAIAS